MSLRYKFRKALSIVEGLGSEELRAVTEVCHRIKDAQDQLCRSARENLHRCYHACEGLCCRNIEIDAIISHWDFVYILMLTEGIRDIMSACLANENLFYSADCVFLKDGTGPCLFPDGIRPETCIVSFCTQTESLDDEVSRVKKAFFRLTWTITRLRIRSFLKRITRTT